MTNSQTQRTQRAAEDAEDRMSTIASSCRLVVLSLLLKMGFIERRAATFLRLVRIVV
jgi:hypothetical protein